jgi:hypothetical protein
MDSIRTLLLARTHTVVLDPDRVASASTRPTRDADLEKFEDELAQLGYVMSLDLAMTIRRLPYQAIVELRTWMTSTLVKALGAHRPHVPLFRGASDAASPYLRRMLTWILTRPVQPCPWCGQVKTVGALEPCGHLVCRSCWEGGSYAGCPICHRRAAISAPALRTAPATELVTQHRGELQLVHLGFDLVGAARGRFEHLVGRVSPLSPDDRAEVEVVIDAMGPKTVQWLPARIPVRETMAIALARLWMVSPDRAAMVQATRGHLETATDVLRVAAVLLGGNPGLVEPMRLRSVPRALRRAVLDAIEHLPADQAIEDMWRHRGLWKRIGERLHPYESADRLPLAALAFAAVRGSRLDTATFGAAVEDEARGVATIRIADSRARVTPWASVVEERLRAGDARGAAERLGQRPGELLRRADHLIRIAQTRQPDALAAVIGAVEAAATRGTPARLLALASHVAWRTEPRRRRVFLPDGDLRKAWVAPDHRPPLRSDATGALVALLRAELVNRAAARRNFARAVIDRGLADLLVPRGERIATRNKRLRWLDVHVGGDALAAVAGDHAAAAAALPDVASADLAADVRPTLWDIAAIHAVARANIVYVRERTGAIATYRRRDREHALGRLARIHAGDDADGVLDELPPANAPTWFALLREDIELPPGSAGYVLEPRPTSERADGVDRVPAPALLSDLTR